MELIIHIIFWMAGTLVFLLTVGLIFHHVVKISEKKRPGIKLTVAPESTTAVERISDLPWTYVSDALVRRDETDNPVGSDDRMKIQNDD